MAKELGKKILNLFYQSQSEEAPAATATESATPPITTTPTAGQKDENIAKTLTAAIEEANIDGFDYIEYAKTVDALKPNLPSEQTLFQTAFASGAVMGATKQKLVDAANHYLSVLDEKLREFEETAKARQKDTVDAKAAELPAIDEKIKAKAEQIQALTEEINKLTADKTVIANEVADNKAKIEQVRNNFMATLQLFTGKIKSDIDKIQKYIA